MMLMVQAIMVMKILFLKIAQSREFIQNYKMHITTTIFIMEEVQGERELLN